MDNKEMYWARCPKCGAKLLRIQRGIVETICTNQECRTKWLITVEKGRFDYLCMDGSASEKIA